ncbi:MAG: DUF4382 domain-containing protein [Myxococcota bacterium]
MRKLRGWVLGGAVLFLGCGQFGPADVGMSAMLGGAARTASSRLAVRLQAAPGSAQLSRGNGPHGVGGLQEIVVSVRKVVAHAAGQGWVVLSEDPVTIDLLRLGDHTAELGFANMPQGKVTQIRLYVAEDPASYVLAEDGTQHPLKVPSGLQSGIKIKGPWNLNACDDAVVNLDMDVKKSIHIHGRGADDTFILRPVIKLRDLNLGTQDDCSVPPADPLDPTPGDDDQPGGTDQPGDDGSGEPEDLCYSTEGTLVPCDQVNPPADGTDDPADGTDGSDDPTDGTDPSGETPVDPGTTPDDNGGGTTTPDPTDGSGGVDDQSCYDLEGSPVPC